MAFGERRSPAAVLHTVLHALRAHGFLAGRASRYTLSSTTESCWYMTYQRLFVYGPSQNYWKDI